MNSGLGHPSELRSPISGTVCPEERRGEGYVSSIWLLCYQRLERQKHLWTPQLDGVPVCWRHIILTLSLPVLLTSWMYMYRNAGPVFKTVWELCLLWTFHLVAYTVVFFLHGSFEERWFCNLNPRQISYHSWLVHLWTLLSTSFQDLLICLSGSDVLGGIWCPCNH